MKNRHAVIAAAVLAFAALPSLIANAASRDEQTKACKGDAIKLCSAEIPDKDKIAACMKQHVDELSPGCKAMFDQGKPSGNGKPKGASNPKS